MIDMPISLAITMLAAVAWSVFVHASPRRAEMVVTLAWGGAAVAVAIFAVGACLWLVVCSILTIGEQIIQ